MKNYFRKMTFILTAFTQAEHCLSDGRHFLEIQCEHSSYFPPVLPLKISVSVTSTS